MSSCLNNSSMFIRVTDCQLMLASNLLYLNSRLEMFCISVSITIYEYRDTSKLLVSAPLFFFVAAFLTQTVCLDDTTVKFEIWDTAGQERYHSLAPMYYRGAQAAIVVYDITNEVSTGLGMHKGIWKLPLLHWSLLIFFSHWLV